VTNPTITLAASNQAAPADWFLTSISGDAVAECHGVSKAAYAELWAAMEKAKPLADIAHEDAEFRAWEASQS
jgi:hypothetical protein